MLFARAAGPGRCGGSAEDAAEQIAAQSAKTIRQPCDIEKETMGFVDTEFFR